MDQDRLARGRPPSIEERTPCGDIRDADAGPFSKRDMAREMMNLIDRAHGALGVRAQRSTVDRSP